jgi:biopolymer transport protein ExbD
MLTKKKKRRAASGLIIRLIDVVLILLFGFIAISEISKKSKIDLPESEAVPTTAPDREVVVYIGILPDGRYLVEDETAVIDDATSLMRYVIQKQSELNRRNIRMRVRVRANYDSEVRYAFTVVNICQDTKIPVGLDVIKKGR